MRFMGLSLFTWVTLVGVSLFTSFSEREPGFFRRFLIELVVIYLCYLLLDRMALFLLTRYPNTR